MRMPLSNQLARACRAAIVVAASTVAAACETSPGYSFFSLGMAQPVGGTRGYVKSPSWRGLTIDARRAVDDHFSLAYSAAWNYMHDQSHQVITFDAGAAEGLHTRTLSVFPILVGGQYGPRMRDDSTRALMPYVGMLVGTYYFERRTSLGLFDVSHQWWRAGIAPQIGVTKRLYDVRLIADLRYNHAFGSPQCTYVGLSLGFSWAY
jgi:hypothetical protein